MASHPKLLLLDEPFNGVEPRAVSDLQAMIRQCKDRGIGILIAEHDVRAGLRLVNRAYLIHRGQHCL